MGKIQMQLYVNGLDKVRRLERALRAVTEDGVPVTAACAKENLQYEWFRRFVSQDIGADRDGQKAAVTVTWDDWSTWQEQLLRNTVGEITPVPEGFDEIYRKIAAECLSKEEREVVRLKYEEMLSLEEVAAQMGITANKVRHILAATLRKLRNLYLRWQLCLGTDYTKALQELHTAQTEYDQAILKKEEELDRTIRQLLTTEVTSLMILVIQSLIQTTRVYRSLSGPNVIPCGMLPEMPGSYPRFRRYRFYGRLQGTLT